MLSFFWICLSCFFKKYFLLVCFIFWWILDLIFFWSFWVLVFFIIILIKFNKCCLVLLFVKREYVWFFFKCKVVVIKLVMWLGLLLSFKVLIKFGGKSELILVRVIIFFFSIFMIVWMFFLLYFKYLIGFIWVFKKFCLFFLVGFKICFLVMLLKSNFMRLLGMLVLCIIDLIIFIL